MISVSFQSEKAVRSVKWGLYDPVCCIVGSGYGFCLAATGHRGLLERVELECLATRWST